MEITVVGAGYVGLVAAAGFASVGHRVVCIDFDRAKVNAINAGQSLLHEPGLIPLVQNAVRQGTLLAATDLAAHVAHAQLILVCVETPSLPEGGIDLRAIKKCVGDLGSALRSRRSYCVVAVKSTVLPGTTEDVLGPILWASAGQGADAIGLVANPEFTREGQAIQDFVHPDRVVIGSIDERSLELATAAYAPFGASVLATTPRTAEMIKYTSNALWAALVSFSNEIAAICEATSGIDVDDVMVGLHMDDRLTPVGRSGERVRAGVTAYLRAGCGYGGSCLPKDISALIRYAREAAVEPRLLEAVRQVNASRPGALVSLAETRLGTLAGRTVAVLGLAFKPFTDDLRKSAALDVVGELLRRQATVRAHDPAAGRHARLQWQHDARVIVCDSVEEALCGADAALIVTAWPEFAALDWPKARSLMSRPFIVDGRRLLDGRQLESAGYEYVCIGRHFGIPSAPFRSELWT